MTRTKRPKSRRPDRRATYTRALHDGIRLEAEVALCVFMYAKYPLTITIALHRNPGERLGKACATDKTKSAENYGRADVTRLIAKVRVRPCPRCSAPAFDPTTVETNRGGLCEQCFIADLEAALAADLAEEERQLAARDDRMKQQGMTVRVDAWIHPNEGDDCQVTWYFAARPEDARIRKLLRMKGSVVTSDYRIVPL